MTDIVFFSSLGSFLAVMFYLAFRKFPGERWQVFAAVPVSKIDGEKWKAVNITYYGILTATGFIMAILMVLIMSSASGYRTPAIAGIMAAILLFFVPSAKLMALIVEKKKHTITVGGAVFVMLMSAPWIVKAENILIFNDMGMGVSELSFMAVIITGYAFGEGFGRLACISFGCCYGKRVEDMKGLAGKLFSKFYFIFEGKTKKISYHDCMDGVRVVPVQGITAVLYTVSGLVSLYLFMKGFYSGAFFVSLAVTQLWRFFSEFLRSDYRGGGSISAYQWMSLFSIPYFVAYFNIIHSSSSGVPSLYQGLLYVWSPGVIIIAIILWIGALLYTGISTVTGAEVKIHVIKENI